jgi:hypothetical protein
MQAPARLTLASDRRFLLTANYLDGSNGFWDRSDAYWDRSDGLPDRQVRFAYRQNGNFDRSNGLPYRWSSLLER